MRHYQVITIGSTTLDAFMTLDHEKLSCRINNETNEICFHQGDKVDVQRYDFQMGGNATNVAVGLSRLGVKATLCSEIGDDEFSIKIRNALAHEQIERLFVTEKHNSQTSFSVIINVKGDRTIFVQDVERDHHFDISDVTCEYIYLTSLGREWQTPYKKAVEFVKENECKLVFNPGSRQLFEGHETVRHVIAHTDVLVVNKEEGEHLLFGEKKIDSSNEHSYIKELLQGLRKMGPSLVVITNGQHGSFALNSEDEYFYRELYEARVVERTGAGDAYTAGFLAGLIHKMPIPDCMTWGAVNSSSVVGHIGAEAGLLTRTEMLELIRGED